uniref:Uncharacterized protein MANES_03G177600 n=1 Tax=Rhizophora mucronata TaxID=61149 RepID=A0A2P2JVT0_RHIMU
MLPKMKWLRLEASFPLFLSWISLRWFHPSTSPNSHPWHPNSIRIPI